MTLIWFFSSAFNIRSQLQQYVIYDTDTLSFPLKIIVLMRCFVAFDWVICYHYYAFLKFLFLFLFLEIQTNKDFTPTWLCNIKWGILYYYLCLYYLKKNSCELQCKSLEFCEINLQYEHVYFGEETISFDANYMYS